MSSTSLDGFKICIKTVHYFICYIFFKTKNIILLINTLICGRKKTPRYTYQKIDNKSGIPVIFFTYKNTTVLSTIDFSIFMAKKNKSSLFDDQDLETILDYINENFTLITKESK